MTPANYGSVFSCCLFSSLMMLYLYPRLFTAIPCEVAEIHVITVF